MITENVKRLIDVLVSDELIAEIETALSQENKENAVKAVIAEQWLVWETIIEQQKEAFRLAKTNYDNLVRLYERLNSFNDPRIVAVEASIRAFNQVYGDDLMPLPDVLK